MLAFLKDKNKNSGGGISIETRKPDSPETESEQNQGLKACADQILAAIEAKDSKRLAQALQDIYDICSAGSSDEYPDEQDTE